MLFFLSIDSPKLRLKNDDILPVLLPFFFPYPYLISEKNLHPLRLRTTFKKKNVPRSVPVNIFWKQSVPFTNPYSHFENLPVYVMLPFPYMGTGTGRVRIPYPYSGVWRWSEVQNQDSRWFISPFYQDVVVWGRASGLKMTHFFFFPFYLITWGLSKVQLQALRRLILPFYIFNWGRSMVPHRL